MQQWCYEQSQGGYIALLIALVLSSALAASGAVLLLVLPLAQKAAHAVQQTEQARLMAHGCARMIEQAVRVGGRQALSGLHIALARLGDCEVVADEVLVGAGRTVHVRAAVLDAVVDLRILLDPVTKEIRAQSESP